MSAPPQLIHVHYDAEHGDNKVRCPVCGYTGWLMTQFSLLSAGFNGIKHGDADNCGLQECGQCSARLTWDDIPTPPETL